MHRWVARMFSREALAGAFRFWERARVLFNVVLLAYVLVRFGGALAALPHKLWTEVAAVAVFTNIVYCAAYPIDLVLQATDYRHMWQTIGRPVLWLAMLALCLALARIALMHMLRGA